MSDYMCKHCKFNNNGWCVELRTNKGLKLKTECSSFKRGRFGDFEPNSMKSWKCYACSKDIEVYVEYEPEFCCNGNDCYCLGEPINPMFCDECEEKYFGKGD